MTKKQMKKSKGFFSREADKPGHLGLKVLGILAFLGALIVLFMAVSVLSIGVIFSASLFGIFLGLPLIIIGVIILFIGLFFAYYGYSLFKERIWAFYLLYVLTILSLFLAVAQFLVFWMSAIFSLVIAIIILWYLRRIAPTVDNKMCRSDMGKWLCEQPKKSNRKAK